LSNFKREYLNTEEKNFYMVVKAFIQMLNGERNLNGKVTNELWTEWEERGMITPSMKKHIKLVRTYLNKFCYEVEENLNDHENEKLKKQLRKFDYKIIDDFTLKKLMRDIKDNMRYAVIEREKFEDTLEMIVEVNCVGCQKDYKDCQIHKMLDDIMVPYCSEQNNCPYAVNLSELTKEEKGNIEKTKQSLHKKNMFYKG
jgi:hypothetical protein